MAPEVTLIREFRAPGRDLPGPRIDGDRHPPGSRVDRANGHRLTAVAIIERHTLAHLARCVSAKSRSESMRT